MTNTNEQESLNRIHERISELENVKALRELVDTFSILADKKDVQEQTFLFTENATVDSSFPDLFYSLLWKMLFSMGWSLKLPTDTCKSGSI